MRHFIAAVVLSLTVAAPAASVVVPVPALDHVVVVVFENKETSSVLGNRAAPTFNAYARRYARLTRYYGVTHPSLPNYLALVSGSTHGITSDCTTCTVAASSLADTLEAAGKTWKTYAEGLPSPGFLGGSYGRYAKKHNPFAYFQDIAGSPSRRAKIVPLPRLATDLRAGGLPDFSLVVPDLCHSMHDCSVAVGDAWLRRTVAPCCSYRGLQFWSCSTKEARLCAAAATRLPSSSAPPYVRARLSRASRITTAHCARSSRRSVFPRSAGRPERDRSRASGVSAACRERRGGLEFHQADADRTRRSARRA